MYSSSSLFQTFRKHHEEMKPTIEEASLTSTTRPPPAAEPSSSGAGDGAGAPRLSSLSSSKEEGSTVSEERDLSRRPMTSGGAPNAAGGVKASFGSASADAAAVDASSRPRRAIFVTVGTTSFDRLVRVTSSRRFLRLAESAGFTHLTIQYGRGEQVPLFPTDDECDDADKDPDADPDADPALRLRCSSYMFKPSLGEDVAAAEFVISHAGAGSILETLSMGKRLLVVINDDLMDNHQSELAEAMERRGYLRCMSGPDELLEASVAGGRDDWDSDAVAGGSASASLLWRMMTGDGCDLVGFPKGDEYAFKRLLDDQMGFSPSDADDATATNRVRSS